MTPFSALTILAASGDPDAPIPDLYRAFYTQPYFLRHCLIVVLLLLFLLAILNFRRRRRPIEIYSNQAGRIHVSPGALADLVESASLQYGAVSRPRVRFEKSKGQLHLYVRFKLGAGQRLPQFSSGLQAHLARALRESFGIENLGGIHVIITGFKGAPTRDDLPPREEESVPYHGAPPAKSSTPTRRGGGFHSGGE